MIEFTVGQKVVCVDAKGGFTNLLGEIRDTHELSEGAIYTIRTISTWDHGGHPVVVRLQEITERKVPVGCFSVDPDSDSPFLASRFRPLVERKTDISVFTKMLRDQEALV
jgi:hypothetical protein